MSKITNKIRERLVHSYTVGPNLDKLKNSLIFKSGRWCKGIQKKGVEYTKLLPSNLNSIFL